MSPTLHTPQAPVIWLDKWCIEFSEVDADDAPWLSQWIWSRHHDQRGKAYVRRRVGNVRLYMHREIMARVSLPPSPAHRYVDHINGDGLDNRRKNLRWATASENALNTPRLGSTSFQAHALRRGFGAAPGILVDDPHESPF